MYLDFRLYRHANSSLWIADRYADPTTVALFQDVDGLLRRPDCRIIKDQRKIKVGHLTIELAGQACSVYIKRYNAYSARQRLGSLLMRSGAMRALRGVARLKSVGVAVPEPIAVIEKQALGNSAGSFFVTHEVAGKTADRYWCEDLTQSAADLRRLQRRRLLEGLARLFRRLHDQRIYHNDLKDVNILVVPDPTSDSESFVLLDLEGVQRCGTLSVRRQQKNLVQLNRTLGNHVSRSLRWYFLKEYFRGQSSSHRVIRDWALTIHRESEQLNALKRSQRQAKA